MYKMRLVKAVPSKSTKTHDTYLTLREDTSHRTLYDIVKAYNCLVVLASLQFCGNFNQKEIILYLNI